MPKINAQDAALNTPQAAIPINAALKISYDQDMSPVREAYQQKLNEYKQLKAGKNLKTLSPSEKKDLLQVLAEVALKKLEIWKRVADRDAANGVLTSDEHTAIVSAINERITKINDILDRLKSIDPAQADAKEKLAKIIGFLREAVQKTLEDIQDYMEKSVRNRFNGAEKGIFPHFDRVIEKLHTIRDQLAQKGEDVTELDNLIQQVTSLIDDAKKEFDATKAIYKEGEKSEEATREAYKEHFRATIEKVKEARQVLDQIKQWLHQHQIKWGEVERKKSPTKTEKIDKKPKLAERVKEAKTPNKEQETSDIVEVDAREQKGEFCERVTEGRAWNTNVQLLTIKYDANKVTMTYGSEKKEMDATPNTEAVIRWGNNNMNVRVEDIQGTEGRGRNARSVAKICIHRLPKS